MHLSQFSDYSLRILIFLATRDGPATARSIADAYDISFHHIAKAARFLAREGYVKPIRGRSGGITLARNPDEISLGELIRKSEAGRRTLVECLKSNGKPCAIAPVCQLVSALRGAEEAFFDHLDGISLADITSNRVALGTFLSMT